VRKFTPKKFYEIDPSTGKKVCWPLNKFAPILLIVVGGFENNVTLIY